MHRALVTIGLVCGALVGAVIPASASAVAPAVKSASASAKTGGQQVRVADPSATQHPKSPAPSEAVSRAGGVPAGEEIVTATSDTGGYHLFAASAGDGWRWHALATLQPGGYSEEAWIGEHCTTGDGRYVVAVVAPWSANNSAAGVAAGGIAYAVDAHSGVVRPLAAGLLLSYFNPGCGTGSSVALSRYTSVEQSSTQILTVDAATGKSAATPVIANQVTSAVPVAGALYAAEGRRLVRIGASGAVSVLSTHGGPVFDLTPNSVGGVDYLAQDTTAGSDPATGVYRLAGGRATWAAGGNLKSLRLLPGLGGRDTVLGAKVGPTAALPARAAAAGVSVNSFADVSTQGTMAVGPSPRSGAVNLIGTNGSVGGGKLPAAAAAVRTLPLPVGATNGTAGASGAAKAGAVKASVVAPPNGGGDVGATCAVPRNDPNYQVPQPSDQQIDWALNLAGQYGLPVRSSGYANLNTGQYDPSADFPLPAPFDGTTGIPRQIMEGIFAQESNWKQASPHAPAGLSGNPLIADYYGIYNKNNSTGNIDFPLADCGYGLGQLTDMMRLANVGDAPSALQKRVALDYTENAAATAQTLANKWNQLSSAGITIGDNNSMKIEDWYFAIWAYNSGINPQASTGNTTGCTPGPSCADSAGNWGLGWTNNPANANYSPLRSYFLRLSYNDASHPQDWPYQEKVFGWIESGQYESDGVTLKYPPTGYYLDQPGFYDFCDSSDNCNALNLTQPCGYNAATDPLQWHCWWHQSASFCLLGACHVGDWNYDVNQAEPSVANPFPSVCAPPANFTDTYIVDDSANETNLAGCTGMAAANAAMTWTPNTDPGGGPFGNVDLHQIGTGYGGRTMFTHLEDTSNAVWGGTMTWAPNNLDYDVYDVEVFIPTLGAAGNLTYTIHPGQPLAASALSINGTVQPNPPASVTVNQNNYGNQWVSLGTYYLSPGSYVTATNVVSGGDGATDVAFDAMAFRPVSSYVSLGDSYSSGEGAGTYDQPTNVPGTNMCHRSALSYARVWTATQNAKTGNNIPMVQLACSGAVMMNLTTTGQYGEPAQIPATPKHVAQVFLTIAGNDAQFAPVLTHCLTPGNACMQYYAKPNSATFSDNLDNTIEMLAAPLADTYQQLRNRVPTAFVDVLTYPSIFPPTTRGRTCLITTALGLAAEDTEWLISESQHLDNVIAHAVNQFIVPGSAATFALQDERYAFAGHELCRTDASGKSTAYVNGLSGLPAGSGDFHPNASGYNQEATDIAASPQGNWPKYTSLRDRLPGTPDKASSLSMLSQLTAAPYSTTPPYKRQYYQVLNSAGNGYVDWLNWPQYGNCTTAQLLLLRDNESQPFAYPIASGTCPSSGSYQGLLGNTGFWHTPYDNNPPSTSWPVTTNNANTNYRPTADHIVPLADSWGNGAYTWDAGLTIDFANDWYASELITASAITNNCPASRTGKCDQSIEQWQPPNPAYLCPYAELWTAIKYQWNLRLDNTPNTGRYLGAGYSEASYLSAVLNGTVPGGCAS